MKRLTRIAAALALAALAMPAAAEGLEAAEELILPRAVRRIEDGAFEGDASIQSVVMAMGATAIGARAFAGCSALTDIYIPDSVESIGAQAFADCAALTEIRIPDGAADIGAAAFSGCPEDMWILTTPGSAAMAYAGRNRLDYHADTVYRALVVGQTYQRYPISLDELVGGRTDAERVTGMLAGFDRTPYACTTVFDRTADEIVAAIARTFGDAAAQDVSLFYFSGHGSRRGALIGADGVGISSDALRAALDRIPGRKIVIVDACYSGALIAAAAQEAPPVAAPDASEQFVSAFMAAFDAEGMKGLAADDYYVMTASAASETSIQWVDQDGAAYSAFTDYLCRGCLGDADQNGNGVVTFDEAFQFTYRALTRDMNLYGRMHAQVYPTNCRWFGFLRR